MQQLIDVLVLKSI